MVKFFKSSLIRKIAVVSILNLVFVCMVIITMGATSLSTNMNHSIQNEMELTANILAMEIEQVFETVITAATDLSYAADAAFSEQDIYTPDEGVYSMVQPDVNISLDIHDFEKYATQSILNSINHSEDLAGMGFLFEPNGFWPGVQDYSVYLVPGNTVDDLTHFLDYSDFSGIDYYQGSKNTMKSYVTSPYLEGNVTVVTISEPIINNGKFVGIVGADVAVDHFGTFLTINPDYPTMNASILDHNHNIAYTTRASTNTGDTFSSVVNNSSDMTVIEAEMAKNAAFSVETQMSGGPKMIRFFQPIHVHDYTWWSVTSIEQSDMNSSTVENVVDLTVASLVLLCFSILVQFFYLQYTLKDIKRVVEAAKQIEAGSLAIDLKLTTGDEIQLLGDSFLSMATELVSMVHDIKYVLAQISNKNLNVQPSASYVGDFSEIESSMVTIVGTMNTIMYEINTSSRQVASGASNVTDGSMTLSQGATEQAETVESLSNRVTDVSDKISENAENSMKANEIFTSLVGDIQEGNTKMKEMITAMEDISTSSKEISKIMKTINDIASQTNILALNASVEAARAGESGKGFAVVASEVKSLAQKSAEAAKTTSVLVQNSVEVVERGVILAVSVEESLSAIIEHADNTKEIMEDITRASNEQAESIHDITTGIHDITGVVHNNSSAAVESAAASEELLAQSESLQTMVSEFKLKNGQ